MQKKIWVPARTRLLAWGVLLAALVALIAFAARTAREPSETFEGAVLVSARKVETRHE